MPHEYDDPISPEAIEQAARLAFERWRTDPSTEPSDHIDLAIHETFCGCALAIEDVIEGGKSGVHVAIEEVVSARLIELRAAASKWDEVDESSDQSFPASDPPEWIGGRPHEMKDRS